MTRKDLFQNSRTKLLLILIMICALCMSLFAVACSNNDEDEVDIPDYSYTQTDDGLISNSNFAYGVLDTDLSKFPKTTPSGWSKSKDSNSDIGSSSSKYGAINVSADGWTELLKVLYKDSNIIDYLEYKNKDNMKVGDKGYSDLKDFAKAYLNDKNSKAPTTAEIQSYIIENYFKVFENPTLHEGAEDNFVYMLNNYRSSAYQTIGTSQKVTSSSTVTLNKGEYGKVSVWVKTQNITEKANGEYGANIRLINKFNGTTQSDYVIKNIIAEDWTQYTIYLKADKTFSTSFQIALGLGYGLAGVTEGTVYFDDVDFTHLTEEEFTTETASLSTLERKLEYNAKNINFVTPEDINENSALVYDMSLENEYLHEVSFDANEIVHNPTVSSVPGYNGYKGEKSWTLTEVDGVDGYDNVTKLDLTNMSYTVKLSNSEFTISNGEYAYVEFMVKNQLSDWGSTDITVNVYDIFDSSRELRKAVTTISSVDEEWQKVGLVFKNNFVEEAFDRTFEIELVVGPTDIVAAKYHYDYASGEVFISPIMMATGVIAQYDDNDGLGPLTKIDRKCYTASGYAKESTKKNEESTIPTFREAITIKLEHEE